MTTATKVVLSIACAIAIIVATGIAWAVTHESFFLCAILVELVVAYKAFFH